MDVELGTQGKHTDIWGLAACVLHLVTGLPPYHDLTMMQTVSAMMRERMPHVPETLPEWLQLLLKQCFSFDAQERPTANQLLEVIWCLHKAMLGLVMQGPQVEMHMMQAHS